MGWPKGKPRPMTPTALQNLAKARQRLADPAVRAKMSAASKAAWADPAVRAKMSAARKAAWAATCVYCGIKRSRYAKLIHDGPQVFCCADERACERRITRSAARKEVA